MKKINFSLTTIIISGILFFSIGFATLRYNVIGRVPWKDFPLFVLDKGLAMAALIMLVTSYGLKALNPNSNSQKWLLLRKHIGIVGFGLSILHVIMSLVLLDKTYSPKFYSLDDSFSLAGNIILIMGVFSFGVFLLHYLSHKNYILANNPILGLLFSKKNLLMGFILLGIHVLLIGFNGWFLPPSWFGYLPPITLVSCVFFDCRGWF